MERLSLWVWWLLICEITFRLIIWVLSRTNRISLLRSLFRFIYLLLASFNTWFLIFLACIVWFYTFNGLLWRRTILCFCFHRDNWGLRLLKCWFSAWSAELRIVVEPTGVVSSSTSTFFFFFLFLPQCFSFGFPFLSISPNVVSYQCSTVKFMPSLDVPQVINISLQLSFNFDHIILLLYKISFAILLNHGSSIEDFIVDFVIDNSSKFCAFPSSLDFNCGHGLPVVLILGVHPVNVISKCLLNFSSWC